VNQARSRAHRTSSGPRRPLLAGPAPWIHVALIAINLAIYAPIRTHDFVNWDDLEYVKSNPNVSGGLSWHGLTWALTSGYAANWHPLTWLSHMVDVQLYGLAAGPHHVTSLLIHIANTLLLFAVLRGMSGAMGRSAFVAGLFAAHPLHVESVAWIAERKDVLSTLFWMLTLWAYAAYVRQPRRGRYLTVVALYVLGLMAKPMLITLPFVLLLMDLWPLRRMRMEAGGRQEWRRLVREKLPLFLLAIVSSVVTIVVQQRGGAVRDLEVVPWSLRIANALVSYAAYLVKTLWPVHLAVVYPYVRPLPVAWIIAASIALAAVTTGVVRARRCLPYLSVGRLW